jgi:hypothetical protein
MEEAIDLFVFNVAEHVVQLEVLAQTTSVDAPETDYDSIHDANLLLNSTLPSV